MQQGLLLWCGTIVAALPALLTAHTFIVFMWLWAVKRLDFMHGAELERMPAPTRRRAKKKTLRGRRRRLRRRGVTRVLKKRRCII